MIDMRLFKADDVRDQAMSSMQLSKSCKIQGRITVPAKGFQCLAHELVGFLLRQRAFGFEHFDEIENARRDNQAAGQDRRSLGAKRRVLYQIEPEQRCEDPERIAATPAMDRS